MKTLFRFIVVVLFTVVITAFPMAAFAVLGSFIGSSLSAVGVVFFLLFGPYVGFMINSFMEFGFIDTMEQNF